MNRLCWDGFRSQAEVSICRDCEYGHGRPWRGNTTCLQTWLRFHSSCGIILACSASFARRGPDRLEDSLMSDGARPQGYETRIA
jgi:hypothetical protein